MKRFSTEALVLVALGLLLALVAVFTVVRKPTSDGSALEVIPSRSAFSAAPGGCKALYQALDGSGFITRRWTRPWTALPREDAALICLSPQDAPDDDEWEALTPWMHEGGLVVFAWPEVASKTPESQRAWEDVHPADPVGLLEGVHTLRVYRQPPSVDELPPSKHFRPWLAAAWPLGAASYARVGHGGFLLLDSPEIAANDAVAERDNLRFLLNAIGNRPVIFDEYHHGHRDYPTLWSVLPTPTRLGLVWLGLGGLLLAWSLSRRPAAPLAEKIPAHPRSEYVDALAGLLKKASAVALARRAMGARIRRRLQKEPPEAAEKFQDHLARLERATTVDELLRLARGEESLWRSIR